MIGREVLGRQGMSDRDKSGGRESVRESVWVWMSGRACGEW